MSGLGLLARNHHGELIRARVKTIQGSLRPESAEIMAIKESLSWIKANGWSRTVVELSNQQSKPLGVMSVCFLPLDRLLKIVELLFKS